MPPGMPERPDRAASWIDSRTDLNRAYVYMALAAFFAQAVGSFWVAPNRSVVIAIVAFFGGAIGLAIHELAAK
jgi:hypothetical protein